MRETCYIVEATAEDASIFLVDMSVAAIRTDRFEYANLDRGTFRQRFSISDGQETVDEILVNGPTICRIRLAQREVVYVAVFHSARRAKKLAAGYRAELKAYHDHFVAANATISSGSPPS